MPLELKPIKRSIFCKAIDRIIDKVGETLGPRVCMDEVTGKPLVVIVSYEVYKTMEKAYLLQGWDAKVCKHCGEPVQMDSPEDGDLTFDEDDENWDTWDTDELLGSHIAS